MFFFFSFQISHFSGSSSTQNPGGAENARVVSQLCLPCYCHTTPSSLCDDVQLYLQLTCCTVLSSHTVSFPLFTWWIFHKPWQCTTKNVILVPNSWNVIGIYVLWSRTLIRSKNLITDLPFILQAVPGWSYPVVYNTNLGYRTTPSWMRVCSVNQVSQNEKWSSHSQIMMPGDGWCGHEGFHISV